MRILKDQYQGIYINIGSNITTENGNHSFGTIVTFRVGSSPTD